MLVTLVASVVMVFLAVSPALINGLALSPWAVVHGQLWRLVTWPFANYIGFGSVITIFFFWYFGSQLESHIGRFKMARFLVWLTLLLSGLAMALAAPSAFTTTQVVGGEFFPGLWAIEIVVFLVWVAENRHARFFFNIPAWLIGAVVIAIPVLQLLGARMWFTLAYLLLSLVVGALVARAMGFLVDYPQIPNLSVRRRPKPPRSPKRAGRGGSAGVVTGPWAGSSGPTSDRAKLDALLDKISAGGMDSLSRSEKKQLEVLRKRIRGL